MARERDVEIRWAALESVNLASYRVTATVLDGAHAGMTARWTVDARSGEAGGSPELRHYRLRLPVSGAGPLHVRAALEAIGPDGDLVLVAFRDVAAAGHDAEVDATNAPSVAQGAKHGPPVLPAGKVAAGHPEAADLGLLSSGRVLPLGAGRCRATALHQLHSRAPPAAA